MRVVIDGPPPSWVPGCTDEHLTARLGAGTTQCGAAYARGRAVGTLMMDGPGGRLAGTVTGSGRRTYETVVTTDLARDGTPVGWHGRCSCPMQVDCKHVAAVVLTARDWLARSAPPPQVSAWEAALEPVIRPEPVRAELAVLGLHLEVITPRSGSAAATEHAKRVRLRPLTPGRAGKWVRTGVSWRDLHSGYGPVRVRPGHRAALCSVLSAFRARQPEWVSRYGESQVHLDELGPGAWRLLAEVRDAGVCLLREPGGEQIEIGREPAQVVLDVRRRGTAGDTELAAVVRLPHDADRDAEEVLLVGAPTHGVVIEEADRLLLVALDRPLPDAVRALIRRGPLHVPAREVQRFLTGYYPGLRRQITVTSGDGSVALPVVDPPRLALQVTVEPDHVTTLGWEFAYPVGDELVRVPIGQGSAGDALRDAPAEQRLLDALVELPDVPGLLVGAGGRASLAPRTVLTGRETAVFAERTLPALQADSSLTVAVSGTFLPYQEVVEAPLISVSAHDAAGGEADWFDLTVSVSVAGHQVPLGPLVSALATGQEQLFLPSGAWFRLDRPELQALRRLVEEARSLQDRESAGLRITPFQVGLWEELVALGVVEHQSERWRRTAGALLALDELPRPEPPRGLQATLRPYQLEGFQWLSLLWDHQLGGILADDMGLGKTLQTLAMAARAQEQGTLGGAAGPLLVVAPTSVVATWASEAARFAPGLRTVTITETARRSGRDLAGQVAGADLVVTSYALLRLDEDAHRELTWSGLVLDEAQFVKNHQAKTYQCARRLTAPFTLAITGTPLENSLMDLWSMLSITAPGLFPNPQRFTELYRRPIESGESPEQLAVLRRRIRPLMLRRTKEQVAADLPPKIEQVLEVTLNPQHRRIYDKHLQRERQRVLGLLEDPQKNRLKILRSLTLLRQLSLDASLVDAQYEGVRSSKIDVLMEQLLEAVAEGHRVLVFSQFTRFLALVRTRLAEEGLAHCYLDGRTRDRPRRIAEFTDGDAPVFLISLKAGGVGLTLTEADYVFVLDPWWNPAAEAQAVDRAHRIGQQRTVMVYRLVATGTIEEKVVALQQRKRDLFDRVVEGDAGPPSALSAEDLRGLFADP